MLRTLPESKKHKWKDSLNKVVHAYNSTRNDATGFSPFYLLFGRSPCLPVDLMFGLSRTETGMNYIEYTEKWKVSMKEAYALARQNISKSAGDGKKQYDRKVRFSNLQPGDRVLVRNLSKRGGPGKLRSHWEQKVHIIVEQKGGLPVYEVTPEGQGGKSRILHRNLLLPCDFLPVDPPEPAPQCTQERRRKSVPAKQQELEVQQLNQGGDSGDEGELPGLSPTELESLQFSTPAAEVDTCEQEQVDSVQDDSLPEDVEELSEQEETPIADDHSSSNSEQNVSAQQESAEPRHYPVRNCHPPNILCYDLLGHPSYHPSNVLSTPTTTATVSADPVIYFPSYLPLLAFTPYGTLTMQNYWMTPYHMPVYPAPMPCVPSNIYQYAPPTGG